MTCAPCQQLWSKAEAGQPDKGVDPLIFQIQVTPSACLTCVRSRFNLHHQIISHTEALGQKLKSEECRCYRCHRGCDICSCWAVSKNNEVPGRSQHSRAQVASLSAWLHSTAARAYLKIIALTITQLSLLSSVAGDPQLLAWN